MSWHTAKIKDETYHFLVRKKGFLELKNRRIYSINDVIEDLILHSKDTISLDS